MAIRSEDLYLSIPNASPIFSKLAISSQFKVSLNLVNSTITGSNVALYQHLSNCGIFNDTTSTYQKYDFLCSSASLPGSNFNISEELGSRQGMTERFATRRIYNEFDLTFYIDSDYNVLRMLEEWMNFINPVYNETNGRYDGSQSSQLGAYQERNTYSRFRYPDDYRRKLSITKFERDFLENPNDRNNTFKNMPLLTYNFIDTFPVNINAVPLSYDGSTFLQVTVVFTYLRHTIEKHGNAQQSVNENLINNQLTQVNPLRPKIIGNEIAPSSSDPVPTPPVGYVSGKPYFGPTHPHDITVRFSSSDVNEFNETITVKNHRRKTGDMLTYIKDDSATAIESMTADGTPGLIDRTNYYIIKIDDDTIQLAASLSDANSGIEIDLYTKGSGNYQLYEKTIKMVGEAHAPFPHAIVYDTLQESLSESSTTGVITQTNPKTETETTAGEGTTQTTSTTETSGGGTTTTETTTTTTTTDSSGSTSSSTSSSSSSSSSDSSSGSSGSSYYSGGSYYGY